MDARQLSRETTPACEDPSVYRYLFYSSPAWGSTDASLLLVLLDYDLRFRGNRRGTKSQVEPGSISESYVHCERLAG